MIQNHNHNWCFFNTSIITLFYVTYIEVFNYINKVIISQTLVLMNQNMIYILFIGHNTAQLDYTTSSKHWLWEFEANTNNKDHP